jgi:hypothetical protein
MSNQHETLHKYIIHSECYLRPKAIDIIRNSLKNGADANAVKSAEGNYGFPPLFCAINKNNYEVAELLIQHGADMTLTNMNFTPLQSACYNKNPDLMKLFLFNGATIHADDLKRTKKVLNINDAKFEELFNPVNNEDGVTTGYQAKESITYIKELQSNLQKNAAPVVGATLSKSSDFPANSAEVGKQALSHVTKFLLENKDVGAILSMAKQSSNEDIVSRPSIQKSKFEASTSHAEKFNNSKETCAQIFNK